jgi:hypothetical protein
MSIFKESFFRVFQADIRGSLRKFFENRNGHITAALALEFADSATLNRLIGLEFLEYDGSSNEYRLDDRVERFLEEMLGAAESVQVDWLTGILEELNRQVTAYQNVADPVKGETFRRRILRLLRTCDSRAQRHLEDIKSAVDIDYRAGSDYEVKLTKLKMHLDRARSFGHAISEMDNVLRNDSFFQTQQGIEILTLRSRLIRRCLQVGDALIDIYQRIEEYLNRILRNYVRARKLIRLRGLIERHEHLSATNIEEVVLAADGPWFREFRFRTLLDPAITDRRPELLERALQRAGMEQTSRMRRVEIHEYPEEDVPPVIDWQNVYETFCRQEHDLFVFLGNVRVEGRPLTEEERIDGFCAILTNEAWVEQWTGTSFETARGEGWEYALIKPDMVTQS